MQVRRQPQRRSPSRGGFTLIELLVVISIIATLAALLLPAIQQAREAGRQATCIDHQHNIAVAVMNFLSKSGEKLPLFRERSATAFIDVDNAGGTGVSAPISWSIQMLPEMDQRALYDRIRDYRAPAFMASGPNTFDQLRQQIVPGFTCPDDPQHQTNGAISYVANIGYIPQALWDAPASSTAPYLDEIDWHDGVTLATSEVNNYSISQAAAPFIDNRQNVSGGWAETGRRNTLSSMYDGESSTILFAENLQAVSWATSNVGDNGFGIGLEAGPAEVGVMGATSATQALQYTGGATPITTNLLTAKERINGNLAAAEGQSPRPSSLHPGGVIMTFGDGRSVFVNETIDSRIYFHLLSPSGSQYGQDVVTSGQIGG